MNTFWLIWFGITNLVRKTYIANVCKHTTKLEGGAASFGERHMAALPLEKNGNPDYCLECIGKMAIRCAWCGKPIRIGDMVTRYYAKAGWKPEFENIRFVDPEQKRPIGCGLCADSCDEYAGRWSPPGRVAEFKRAYAELAPA